MAALNTIPGSIFLIFLCLLSALSFAPQLKRLWVHRNSSGISLIYVLFNLISATQQLTIGGLYLGFRDNVHVCPWDWLWPRGLTNWINLAQLLVVWAGFLLIFIVCLATSPLGPGLKALYVLVYFLVLLVTLLPLVWLLNDPDDWFGGKNDPWFGHWWLWWNHVRYIVPIVTFLAAVAVFPQIRAILGRQPGEGLGGLSLTGLWLQAIIFASLAVSWVYRVPWTMYEGPGPEEDEFGWYRMVGWTAVNNAIFAAVQAFLFLLARGRTVVPGATSSETEPLFERGEL